MQAAGLVISRPPDYIITEDFIAIRYRGSEYVVIDYRNKVVARAKREKDGELVYKKLILSAAPIKSIFYERGFLEPNESPKIKMIFEKKGSLEPIIIGPLFSRELARGLIARGLSYIKTLESLDIYISIISHGLRFAGREIVKKSIESPGFFWLNGRVAVNEYDVESPLNRDRLEKALKLLDELVTVWYGDTEERKTKFVSAIKWGAVAPFFLVLRQMMGAKVAYLHLYGEPGTGKETIGRIILKMWGLGPEHEVDGRNIKHLSDFYRVVGMSTFPILITNASAVFRKREFARKLRGSAEFAQIGGHPYDIHENYYSYASFIFIDDKLVPLPDNGMLVRMIFLQFTPRDKIPEDRREAFRAKVEPRLELLSEIGKCIAKQVLRNNELLEVFSELYIGASEAGERLLGRCYEEALLKPPAWLKLWHRADIDSIALEDFRNKLLTVLDEKISKFFSRRPDKRPQSIEDKLRAVAKRSRDLEIRINRDGREVVRLYKDLLNEVAIYYDKLWYERLGWRADTGLFDLVTTLEIDFKELVEFLKGTA